MIDHLLTSNNPNERPERNLQEQHTLPRRIDLRTVAFGDAKLRLFAKLQKRRASSPTRPRSVLYPADEEQSLPYQTLIHDSGWLFRLYCFPYWFEPIVSFVFLRDLEDFQKQ